MKARKRNYKAEYARRIQRAKDRGYSKSVARGHANKREAGINAAKLLGVKPGTDLDALIGRDARRVFGFKPRIVKGTGKPSKGLFGTGGARADEFAPEYQLILAEYAKRDGLFDWSNEARFIEQMQAIGMTERDAYTHWFSPE